MNSRCAWCCTAANRAKQSAQLELQQSEDKYNEMQQRHDAAVAREYNMSKKLADQTELRRLLEADLQNADNELVNNRRLIAGLQTELKETQDATAYLMDGIAPTVREDIAAPAVVETRSVLERLRAAPALLEDSLKKIAGCGILRVLAMLKLHHPQLVADRIDAGLPEGCTTAQLEALEESLEPLVNRFVDENLV